MKLEGKVAVITGGNSGIGLAVAKAFGSEGARVAILGRSQSTLEDAVDEIGPETICIRGDVGELADLELLYQTVVERFGKIDILFANAGIAKFSPIYDFTEELFDEICRINFKGVFFTIQRAIPHLRDNASVIVNAGSGNSSHGKPLTSIYTATKAAVRSLARTLSAELVDRGIRINALSPGMTHTPIIERDSGLSGELKEAIARRIESEIPLKRMGTPEEMVGAAVFLASSESRYCVGSEIAVDGGLCQI